MALWFAVIRVAFEDVVVEGGTFMNAGVVKAFAILFLKFELVGLVYLPSLDEGSKVVFDPVNETEIWTDARFDVMLARPFPFFELFRLGIPVFTESTFDFSVDDDEVANRDVLSEYDETEEP